MRGERERNVVAYLILPLLKWLLVEILDHLAQSYRAYIFVPIVPIVGNNTFDS